MDNIDYNNLIKLVLLKFLLLEIVKYTFQLIIINLINLIIS
jgi:hypothetical protein